jgi:hypothetical protein
MQRPDCPEDCFQGSTDFYRTSDGDDLTPSYLEAQPLVDNVGTRKDGSIPPWMQDSGDDPERGRLISPSQRYVEWFNGIWHTGDPSSWDATVFTQNAVMIDPTGISKGAQQAAASFIRLFDFYPELRGEVVSWAANDREIFINWRFKIIQRDNQAPLLVAVVDKFCFVDGRVSYRLAFFDLISFAGYLSATFGSEQLVEYLTLSLRAARATGGVQSLFTTLRSFVKGIFLWAPKGDLDSLRVTAGDRCVKLQWPAAQGATYYRIRRASAFSGPYVSIGGSFKPPLPEVSTLSYEDRDVKNGTAYWYTVTPYFSRWRAVAVGRANTDGVISLHEQ